MAVAMTVTNSFRQLEPDLFMMAVEANATGDASGGNVAATGQALPALQLTDRVWIWSSRASQQDAITQELMVSLVGTDWSTGMVGSIPILQCGKTNGWDDLTTAYGYYSNAPDKLFPVTYLGNPQITNPRWNGYYGANVNTKQYIFWFKLLVLRSGKGLSVPIPATPYTLF